MFGYFCISLLMIRIRKVTDCVALACQVTRKLKRAIILEFTTESAIFFIHCWQLGFIVYSKYFLMSSYLSLSKILSLSNVITFAFSINGFKCSFSIALIII